ncbi:MAG: hypothetical protein RBQ71_03160 [Acholeplasmataceae bacterium]|jgi:hypothetical protein|nr:hypothetical protein [Acholeplasmataceae bacterium]
MTKDEVLTQTSQKELNPKQAYNLLYKNQKERKPRRASFVKVRIHVPESRGVNIFLSVILLLPLPIFLIKWIIGRRGNQVINDQFQLTANELIELISIKGVKVDVKSHTHERVLIKTI